MRERDWRIIKEDNDIQIRQGKTPLPFRTWAESGLPEVVLENLVFQNYTKPLPI